MSAVDAPTRWLSSPESVQPEPKAPIDREYWLAHCEGYRVDSPGGRSDSLRRCVARMEASGPNHSRYSPECVVGVG